MVSLKENYCVWGLMTCKSFTHRVSYLAVGWMRMIFLLYKQDSTWVKNRQLKTKYSWHSFFQSSLLRILKFIGMEGFFLYCSVSISNTKLSGYVSFACTSMVCWSPAVFFREVWSQVSWLNFQKSKHCYFLLADNSILCLFKSFLGKYWQQTTAGQRPQS